jgi:hypothetical protein
VTVYTEHTDRIHPRDLSDSLAKKVGKDRFRVSLRKNIYIIYVDAQTYEKEDVSIMRSRIDLADGKTQKQDTHSDDGEERTRLAIEPPTYQQRLEDFNMAEKILCAARLPHQ